MPRVVKTAGKDSSTAKGKTLHGSPYLKSLSATPLRRYPGVERNDQSVNPGGVRRP